MVTEIKPGDRFHSHSGYDLTVRYVGKTHAFIEYDSGTEDSLKLTAFDRFVKIEPFFEVGKTYRSPHWYGTFDVHHVGYIGAIGDGRKYAAGQFNRSKDSDHFPLVREHFAEWAEV